MSEHPEVGVTVAAPFVVGPATSRPNPWRVVVDPERTDGMSLGDVRMPAHTPGPSRHVHTREDEGVYIFSGVLTAEVGQERFEVGPESFLWLPRGVPHTFANLSDDEVWAVGLVNPSGLERFFAELAEYLGALEGPPDSDVILAMNARYGIFPADGPPLI